MGERLVAAFHSYLVAMRMVLLWLFIPLAASGQLIVPTLFSTLDPVMNETSGLMHVNGEVWTVLDSGNPNRLYMIGPSTGDVQREVVLAGATNVDWEEVATDGTWVYVGDFGNNGGARTDLRVYRFPLDQLSGTNTGPITTESIDFAYVDQTEFTLAYDDNNWDCEAFIPMGDSLFLFTKNWADGRTKVYAIPAIPGTHLAHLVDSFDVQGLVTAASRHPNTGDVVLLGYTRDEGTPFIWIFSGFEGRRFFSGSAVRGVLDMTMVQTEGIAWAGASGFWMSNERSPFSAARLWHIDRPNTIAGIEGSAPTLCLLPTPTAHEVQIIGADPAALLRIMDINGRMVVELRLDTNGKAHLPELPAGRYFAEVPADGVLHRQPMLIAH